MRQKFFRIKLHYILLYIYYVRTIQSRTVNQVIRTANKRKPFKTNSARNVCTTLDFIEIG